MKVKIKKLHKDAVIPTYAKPGDAGLDLTAISVEWDGDFRCITYKTGLSIEIPEGHVGLLFPRSSIYKKELLLTNSVGVIDSGYRGEIIAKFAPNFGDFWDVDKSDLQNELDSGKLSYYPNAECEYRENALYADIYGIKDKIVQLIIIPYPKIELEEVNELSSSERGEGGFGSTGN